jgi:hypothetical protein
LYLEWRFAEPRLVDSIVKETVSGSPLAMSHAV